MPAYIQIGDPTPGRLKAAVSFIIEGKAVDFDGFSLAVVDGVLHVCAEYSNTVRDDARGIALIEDAQARLNQLLEIAPEFGRQLSGFPRHYSLIHSYGTGDVEVAQLSDGSLHWQPGVKQA
jgi:hypothetical protein